MCLSSPFTHFNPDGRLQFKFLAIWKEGKKESFEKIQCLSLGALFQFRRPVRAADKKQNELLRVSRHWPVHSGGGERRGETEIWTSYQGTEGAHSSAEM